MFFFVVGDNKGINVIEHFYIFKIDRKKGHVLLKLYLYIIFF
jgi:hypothetical protein